MKKEHPSKTPEERKAERRKRMAERTAFSARQAEHAKVQHNKNKEPKRGFARKKEEELDPKKGLLYWVK